MSFKGVVPWAPVLPVVPWSPVIPVKMVPSEAGGDTGDSRKTSRGLTGRRAPLPWGTNKLHSTEVSKVKKNDGPRGSVWWKSKGAVPNRMKMKRRKAWEPDRGDVHALSRRTRPLLVHEVQQELADLRLPQLGRRAVVVGHEVLGAAQVLHLRRRSESTQIEIVPHLVPDGSYDVLLWRDHRQPG